MREASALDMNVLWLGRRGMEEKEALQLVHPQGKNQYYKFTYTKLIILFVADMRFILLSDIFAE